MRLTVAICTWNRADSLQRTLGALTRLTVPGHVDWELIVVANGCTDHTPAVLREFEARLPLRVLTAERPGLSMARNLAVIHATGSHILWTDDDVLADRQWMASYAEAIERLPEAALFGGPVLPRFEARPPRWLRSEWHRLSLYYAIRECDPGYRPVMPDYVPFGANLAIKLDVQRRFAYNPMLGRRGAALVSGEDWELVQRVLAAGEIGWWVADAAVHHVIGAERLRLAHIRRIIRSDAELSVGAVGAGRGPTVLGRPLWLWKKAFVAEARYRWARISTAPAEWVERMHEASVRHGQLRGWGVGRATGDARSSPIGSRQ